MRGGRHVDAPAQRGRPLLERPVVVAAAATAAEERGHAQGDLRGDGLAGMLAEEDECAQPPGRRRGSGPRRVPRAQDGQRSRRRVVVVDTLDLRARVVPEPFEL